jgi:hypothetical protein
LFAAQACAALQPVNRVKSGGIGNHLIADGYQFHLENRTVFADPGGGQNHYILILEQLELTVEAWGLS